MLCRLVPALLTAQLMVTPVQSRTLFTYEQQQLTREHVASLPEEDAVLIAFEDQFSQAEVNTTDKRCRYDPPHPKWPSAKAWAKLTKQLSSADALLTPSPHAAVCYGNARNDAQCSSLASSWTSASTHIDDPIEILSPLYQGLTCQPPSIYNSGNCSQGGSPAYVIKAKTVSDIQSGVNFARNDWMRLVVKNTGHDFAGKSTGYGALSIWTHSLKDLQYFNNYADESGYRGAAIKVGAGVQTADLYKFASQNNVIVVAGSSQTVGFAGGFIQGGGYSPLSSIYGMASDQVLGFEVVTPIGEFVTANSTSNQDLFWALRGGGASTFGVVTSVTVKAFEDLPVATATWTLDSSKLGKDKFWAAARAYFDRAVDNVNNGTYGVWNLAPKGSDLTLTMQPLFAPNKTASQLNTLLAPYFSKLTSLNIPFSPTIKEYSAFYPAWQASFIEPPSSDVSQVISSRLFPRTNFNTDAGRNSTFNVLRASAEAGQTISAINTAPKGLSPPDTALNPAWRKAIYHIIASTHIDPTSSKEIQLAARAALTNGTMAKWRDVSYGMGAYLNEADRMEPDWQQSFWGANYERLLSIKKEMDPRETFWANQAVGSEEWRVESFDGLPNENGKLCKVDGTGS